MKRPAVLATATKTSRAVRVSILFVVTTATVAALIGAAAVISRWITS